MGKKKWCYGREDFVCLTRDCPYMSGCIKVVWEKKVSRMIARMKPAAPAPVESDEELHPVPARRR